MTNYNTKSVGAGLRMLRLSDVGCRLTWSNQSRHGYDVIRDDSAAAAAAAQQHNAFNYHESSEIH